MFENEPIDVAINALSPRIREILNKLSYEIKNTTYEIRLRANKPLTLYGKYGTVFVNVDATCSSKTSDSSLVISSDEIHDSFNRVCAYSVHTHQRDINNGFVTMKNGNRVGVCGTAVRENNGIKNIKDISSLNIRLAKEIKGCADNIVKDMKADSIIIAGPPNSGKTTVIRDIVRQMANGSCGKYIKVAVIDERKEIAGVCDGVASTDIGITADVLDSYPKAQGIDIAVRTLSPQYVVCDEVSTEDEVESIKRGVNSGVKFIVSVHAGSEDEIMNRKQIEELINTYSFSTLYLLDNEDNIGNIKAKYDIGELRNEIYRRRIGFNCMHDDRI